MSGHYGEDAVKAKLTFSAFSITITNHHTNAEIKVTGPLDGVFEKKGREITQGEVENVGREIAHLLRRILV